MTATKTLTYPQAVALAERHAGRGDHDKARTVYSLLADAVARTGNADNPRDRWPGLALPSSG